jgi:hypothetical protein
MYIAAFHHNDATPFPYALWSVQGKVETRRGLPNAGGFRIFGNRLEQLERYYHNSDRQEAAA